MRGRESHGDYVEAAEWDTDLAYALRCLNHPSAVTLAQIDEVLERDDEEGIGLAWCLAGVERPRTSSIRLQRLGYVRANNPNARDGRWTVAGRRCGIYAKEGLTRKEQVNAARRLIKRVGRGCWYRI